MGYTTNFIGAFTLSRKLTGPEYLYLYHFSRTRRMKREACAAAAMKDPWRKAVNLSVGCDGEYFVNASGFAGQGKDASIIEYNIPPGEQPGLWCKWVPETNRQHISWNGVEKFYDYVEWLEYLIEHFLDRWGITVRGIVKYYGEADEDFGFIVVKDNKVRQIKGTIESYLDKTGDDWVVEEIIFNLNELKEQVSHPYGRGAH